MYKIGFVILNYCTPQETLKCVKSIIERIDTFNYEIIIVDNNSPDNSGKKLKSYFRNTEKVTLILNNENMGFAQGNNIGFSYAKYTLRCNFIITLNSDTYLVQNDFSGLIFQEFENSSFAVLGPRIITVAHQYCENPGRNTVLTIKEINTYILKVQIRLIFNYFLIEGFYNKILKFFSNHIVENDFNNNVDRKVRHENVQLHGCCLVFSPVFLNRFDGFYDKTFLYREEEILFTSMMSENLKTVYNPKIKIFHEEDASLDTVSKKNIYKLRFIYRHLIRSSKILKSILKDYYSSKRNL